MIFILRLLNGSDVNIVAVFSFEINMTKEQKALVFIRISLALTMIIHGLARIMAGGVLPFGDFLSSQKFPLGFYLAWIITIFEIVGGLFLAIGFYVSSLAILFAIQLLAGIVLVHASNGWFVVGLGRNGMEYSVLLIILFLCVSYSNLKGDSQR